LTDDDSDNPNFLPKKEFVFTFSPSEWQQIQPQEIFFKANDKNRPMRSCRSYYVLPKGAWTPLLAEHFWEHTNSRTSHGVSHLRELKYSQEEICIFV